MTGNFPAGYAMAQLWPCAEGDGARIPMLRDRVRVVGHDGVFLVASVDEGRRTADLARVDAVGFLADVEFTCLRPAHDWRAGLA